MRLGFAEKRRCAWRQRIWIDSASLELLLIFARGYDHRYASAHTTEGRNKDGPSPRKATGKFEHHGQRCHQKPNAHEDINDPFL
jgi:hypothetical protein